MSYKYGGKVREIRAPYVPFSDAELRAKFARYRESESRIYLGPEIRPRNQQPHCGTYSGWSKHKRDGSEVCRPCAAAQILYQREYRARKRAA